jgi:hypothetical protein
MPLLPSGSAPHLEDLTGPPIVLAMLLSAPRRAAPRSLPISESDAPSAPSAAGATCASAAAVSLDSLLREAAHLSLASLARRGAPLRGRRGRASSRAISQEPARASRSSTQRQSSARRSAPFPAVTAHFAVGMACALPSPAVAAASCKGRALDIAHGAELRARCGAEMPSPAVTSESIAHGAERRPCYERGVRDGRGFARCAEVAPAVLGREYARVARWPAPPRDGERQILIVCRPS